MLTLKKTETYTFEEFFSGKAKENKFEINKDEINKTLKVLGTGAVITVASVLLFNYFSTTLAGTTTCVMALETLETVEEISKFQIFNEFVVGSLNKLYVSICFAGFIVEAILSNANNDKKLMTCITKYATTYGMGLLVLSILNMINQMC